MDYLVVWSHRVRDDILRFHQAARTWQETAVINRALTVLEEALLRRPLDAGESRDGRRRVIYEPPLFIEYDVFAEERSVEVVSAYHHPRP